MKRIPNSCSSTCPQILILQHVVFNLYPLSGKPICSLSRPEFSLRARSKSQNAGHTCAKTGDKGWKGWTVHRFRIIRSLNTSCKFSNNWKSFVVPDTEFFLRLLVQCFKWSFYSEWKGFAILFEGEFVQGSHFKLKELSSLCIYFI